MIIEFKLYSCCFVKGPASFKAEEVVNLSSAESPLWAVKLRVGDKLRTELAKLFDPLMCAERNGNLYVWNPVTLAQQLIIKRIEKTNGWLIKNIVVVITKQQ